MEETSLFNPQTLAVSLDGQDLTFETGKIARLANGAVTIRSGDTILLATACSGKEPLDANFLPLRIDYQEKFSSAGKTLGGFIKREGRPTERETLVARLIDRPLRPLFEDGYYTDTQIVVTVLSYDGVHAPDTLAICGAAAALSLSDIPLIKPVGAVRVGMIEDRFVINPTIEEQASSVLDLVLAGTEDAILMIEGYCDFLTEEQIMHAVEVGHQAIKKICQSLADWQQVVGKPKNLSQLRPLPSDLFASVDQLMAEPLQTIIRTDSKAEREAALAQLSTTVMQTLCPEEEEAPKYTAQEVEAGIKKVSAHHMRQMVLNENKRCDGRKTTDVRPISIEMQPLPRTHGSTLFTRGETQSLAVCTLGGESMGQRFETLNDEGIRRFYLQYAFPPYSVNEVGRLGPLSRRETGHGKLAERGLLPTVPTKDQFPYVIRLESNITESNGSSSMASVCGGCLALMDAGVPIKRPVAGIAMGLILEQDRYAILSDILGIEDALGDMDFKVTGDDKGITAFQLDIKVEGITPKIMQVALAQAKEGRVHILNKMLKACPHSRAQLSSYAPRIETIQIKPSQIATVIGPGGKQIRAITEETGVDINIDDNGCISIASVSKEGMDRAKAIIGELTAEVELGKVYKGEVAGVKDFGLFVAILNKQGLCHISEVSHSRVKDLNKLYRRGDSIEVKVIDINENGQIRLSHKALLPEPAGRE
ncbi:MAG: polyribonucleotide nucleotidyltransferase [Chlamydiota bacterium]